MKTQQLRKLNLISRFIDLDQFYVVDLESGGHIKLQGNYSSDLVKRLQKWFKFSVSDQGYTEATRNGVDITLT